MNEINLDEILPEGKREEMEANYSAREVEIAESVITFVKAYCPLKSEVFATAITELRATYADDLLTIIPTPIVALHFSPENPHDEEETVQRILFLMMFEEIDAKIRR